MANVFTGKSLTVIDDLSIEERKYLFEKTRILKKAIQEDDKQTMDKFRINDKDFGIYEVFLESSTRTKESFRNAANFHQVKLSDLAVETSSFNKGESYADTFNTLAGYRNAIFIVRSKIEGVCRWLEDETQAFAKRNNLKRKPAFINAGDGKHEHPTQELLDEFTFLEENNWSFKNIHLALVGDLYHGRTVHSKADGLKIFESVTVDLIAPSELAMPDYYKIKMKENGFKLREFSSIEEYLNQDNIAKIWYFTRPQLERMGEQILKKQEELRRSITFKKEFIRKLPENTRFYHPLPRHRKHPTIPSFLDGTTLNGWESQSINGMYVRIVLLSMIAGKIGEDYSGSALPGSCNEGEEYIVEVPVQTKEKSKVKTFSEGVRPIQNGIVIDHICRGDTPASIRRHIAKITKVMKLEDGKGGEWISTSTEGTNIFKGIIFRPGEYKFSRADLKRLAGVAASCTLNIIKDGKIEAKYRTHLPPRIYNFEDLICRNEACVSHPAQAEGAPAMFYRTSDNRYACQYCGTIHSFKEIWGDKPE
ncbi:bifunctional aspartate carbamoyltransferase catalytic subunit/aspartate carbamoyltransferase regulatory subunit [Treponema pedis]|uniref:Aspartate carbamoyltransferase n=1 Tax=Treponema pedis TaxID=409322 RepID=A0A7S7AX72_9SPIR|nr:bifunctional aspartate carbamoyltransferase catalytic subunit/aspartate carbamoyltransferase regulatory subunit [Treponema pedis]QOW60826.1 bifunctional aspartate carbamoyltransferase catalytic subunit/aspartate carbamoyltransferase regulatory subunit [Treponema pedis]